jgi:hypothetical protein
MQVCRIANAPYEPHPLASNGKVHVQRLHPLNIDATCAQKGWHTVAKDIHIRVRHHLQTNLPEQTTLHLPRPPIPKSASIPGESVKRPREHTLTGSTRPRGRSTVLCVGACSLDLKRFKLGVRRAEGGG